MDNLCFDNPKQLLDPHACITALSKSTDEGTLKLGRSREQKCREPECVTVIREDTLDFPLKSTEPCDGALANLLDGHIHVASFVSAGSTGRIARVAHAGDLVWKTTGGDVLTGRMSGITNAGLVRKPLRHPIEECVAPGVLTGRLCAHVIETKNPLLRGVQVTCVYRIELVKPTTFHGTFDGVVVSPCAPV